MRVDIVCEDGYDFALYGIGLSYGLTSDMSFDEYCMSLEIKDRMYDVSCKLAHKDGGHNKFLEHISISMIIDAPRYWWSQFDTYRVGITKNSESTMHTILKTPIKSYMFEGFDFDETIPNSTINRLEILRQNKNWRQLKRELPESFIQRRCVKISYMNLRNIIRQRKNHRLIEWEYFCNEVMDQIKYPEYLKDILDKK